jgi:hypothetical protein
VALQAVTSHLPKLTGYGFRCRTWTFGIDTPIRVVFAHTCHEQFHYIEDAPARAVSTSR